MVGGSGGGRRNRKTCSKPRPRWKEKRTADRGRRRPVPAASGDEPPDGGRAAAVAAGLGGEGPEQHAGDRLRHLDHRAQRAAPAVRARAREGREGLVAARRRRGRALERRRRVSRVCSAAWARAPPQIGPPTTKTTTTKKKKTTTEMKEAREGLPSASPAHPARATPAVCGGPTGCPMGCPMG